MLMEDTNLLTAFCLSLRPTGTVSQEQIRLATSNAHTVSYYRTQRHVFLVFKIRFFSILPNVLPNKRNKSSDSDHSFFHE